MRGFATTRQERITELVREKGFIRNSELSGLLGVSEVTIRQDLKTLESNGVVRKTFGGAVIDSKSLIDSPFLQRATIHQEEKQRIGAAAVNLIKPGETIILDAGTTTIEIAKRLPQNYDLTVVTCAVNIALEASAKAGVTIIQCGGEFNSRIMSVVGHEAERMLQEVHAHKLFIGTYGVDFTKGLTDRNFASAQVKRTMINSTREVILVCDSSKFGEIAPVWVSSLDVVHRIITDKNIPESFKEYFQKVQISVNAV
ncbi:MAG: DeoR/GlpR transcriptional regulator [Planctomycetes bacterium]|nr:DeoR/GlpR transcriptional regulator [Planctomycetota bacterium]